MERWRCASPKKCTVLVLLIGSLAFVFTYGVHNSNLGDLKQIRVLAEVDNARQALNRVILQGLARVHPVNVSNTTEVAGDIPIQEETVKDKELHALHSLGIMPGEEKLLNLTTKLRTVSSDTDLGGVRYSRIY